MKITHGRAHAVSVLPTPTALYRLDPSISLAEQCQREARHKWIVEVITDEGLVGWGESGRGASEESIRDCLTALLGLEPLRLNLRCLPVPAAAAYDVAETALYDLVGKALGYSACQLLGGPFRDWVPVHYWMGKRTPEQSADIAQEARDRGFTGIKIKCGNDAPDQDTVARITAIRHAVGDDFELELDANGGFKSHPDLVGLCERLFDLGVARLEDPFHRSEPAAFAALRPRTRLPLAYHSLSMEQALEAVRQAAAPAMNVGCGGLAMSVRMADFADAAGMASWHGSSCELGLRDAAFLATCAASPGCTLSSDLLHFLWEDDLLEPGLEVVQGQVRLPTGPGLGVSLDYEAIARYRVAGFEV